VYFFLVVYHKNIMRAAASTKFQDSVVLSANNSKSHSALNLSGIRKKKLPFFCIAQRYLDKGSLPRTFAILLIMVFYIQMRTAIKTTLFYHFTFLFFE
jgi:hypothetical protein